MRGDCWGTWLIMLGFMDLGWPRVCRRSVSVLYQNAVLFHIILVVTHGEIFGYLVIGDTGTLTVNKMALPIEVSAEMVPYTYFYWKKYNCNWVTKLSSRYWCNMSRIWPRLIRCHWSCIHGEWKAQATRSSSEHMGPGGSTSHIINNRHSWVKTWGASCIGGFGQTAKTQKLGCVLY